jgi:hypothetical protein
VASTVDATAFLLALSRFASNGNGTQAHLQRIDIVQDAFCQVCYGV